MTPYIVKMPPLPPIYRGCTWPAVILRWKDRNGNPMSLFGWTPLCATTKFNLNAVVVNPLEGVTRLSLTRFQTAGLKLGTESWDWVWLNNFDTTITAPVLAGKIEIKEPLASLQRPLP